MKKNITDKLQLLAVVCVFTLCAAAGAAGQTDLGGGNNRQNDRVLVESNPPLRQSDVAQLIEFFEWLFQARFTADDRADFQALAVKEYKTGGDKAIRGIKEILESHAKFKALGAAQREKVRQELLPQIAGSFQREHSEVNEFLSGVYQNAGQGATADDSGGNGGRRDAGAADGDGGGGGSVVTLAELAGTWSTSTVSGERYKNLTTGDLSDASGSMSEYVISPNGAIKYTGYLSTTIYACSTKLFFMKEGKISVRGSNITFDYTSGERDYQNTCNSSLSGVKPIPPKKSTYPFTLERDQYGLKLCTLQEDGVRSCLYKKR